MTLYVRRIELVPRTLEAVRFVGSPAEMREVWQWVQDRSPEGQVVLANESMYIFGPGGTEKVEEGEWVLYDLTDQQMTSATDGAVQAFYRDVVEASDG